MRNSRLAALSALIVVGSAGVVWWYLRAPALRIEPHADRNVLIVTIDTLRGDALGSYGGRAATPNLDQLADRGARFTFAHAHAVLTLPSHVSLLTGRYPYEHGIRDNAGFRVRSGEVTLAGRLKSLGFATGAFVSAYPLDQRYGLNTGFDVYDDRFSETGTTAEIAVPERRADVAVASAVDWIGRQSGKWFGWVHVFDPHAPYAAPSEWQAKYPSDAYAAEVAWTDFALGPLLERLEREARPTLVIVTSDHGEGLGEHSELTHGIFAYESTLHVPLIVAEVTTGGTSAPGVVVTSPVRHVDVVPTVLAALGADVPSDLLGSPLPEIIAGRRDWSAVASAKADRPSYFESMMPVLARGWAPLRGVIAGRDKYIDLPIPELYDLSADRGELQNLAPLRAERSTVLVGILRGFNVAPPHRPAEETAAARERLRALGYTGGSPASVRDKYTENDDPKRLIDLDRMLHRAREAFQAGQAAEAINLYQQVITRRPDTTDAYRNMAFALWQIGRPEAAVATLQAAIKNGVSAREIPMKLGIYLSQLGEAAKAIPLLEALPQDDTEVLNALGMAYGQAGRTADAMRAFRRALELDSTSGLAHQNIGTLHLRAGDLAAAEAALREALRIDPTLAGAYTTLGVVLGKTGRGPEAVEAWKRAVDIEPTEFDALYNLTLELVTERRLDEARQFGHRFVTTAPPTLYGADIAQIRKLIER